MQKPIHKVQPGDLVSRVKYTEPWVCEELFMVMDITQPIGYEHYRGDPLKTHEISLKLWEVTEPPNHTHWAAMNLYEVV